MRKLLDFIVSKRHWFLFILLELASLILIYHNHSYQRSLFINSANVITGGISSAAGEIISYINLRKTNQELLETNGQLEMELLVLKEKMGMMEADSSEFIGFSHDSTDHDFHFTFITANVVNNSVTNISNYITINKGGKDGIKPDMGVVSERGIVGIVSTVSDHFSVVISLLNPKLRLSGKVKGSNYFGSLNWNGRSSRYINLDELPRHVEFQTGDTIVTSGYSSVFPAGIMIGTISSFQRQRDDNFHSLEVELSTDFHALGYVKVIKNYEQQEQRDVERAARRND